jgi:hypothetical protein
VNIGPGGAVVVVVVVLVATVVIIVVNSGVVVVVLILEVVAEDVEKEVEEETIVRPVGVVLEAVVKVDKVKMEVLDELLDVLEEATKGELTM